MWKVPPTDMHVVTNDEARRWCAEHGLPFDHLPHWTDTRIQDGVRFLTDRKQSVVEALIRHIVGYDAFDEGIVWITDWPLYKPDEMAVITRFRGSIGESRQLIDAPGHIFGAKETPDCIGCFNLCVQYFWDALLFVPTSGLLIFNSHDGFQYASSLSESGRAELQSIVTNYDLKLQSS
jgi:hypothetical protein